MWLTFFCFGSVLGRTRFLASWLVCYQAMLYLLLIIILAIGLSTFCHKQYRKLIKPISAAIAALIWSSYHSAPPLNLSDSGPFVLRGTSTKVSNGPVIIEASSGQFESYGSRSVAGTGEVTIAATPSIFSRNRSYFHVSTKSNDNAFVNKIKTRFKRRTKHIPATQRDWLAAVMLGEIDLLPRTLHHAVRQTGLHHLLVISGLHLTVVTVLAHWVLAIVPSVLNSFGVISAAQWKHSVSVIRIGIVTVAIGYFIIVGSPPNAERALIASVLAQLSRVFFGSPHPLQRLKILLCCQSLLFPLGFLSEANILGWGAYLIIIELGGQIGWHQLHHFRGLLQTQLRMAILAAAVFGECNLLPILFMPTLMPVFALILGITVISLIPPPAWGLFEFATKTHLALQWLLFRLADVVDHAPWLSRSGDELPNWYRPIAIISAAIILLNAASRLSVSRFNR